MYRKSQAAVLAAELREAGAGAPGLDGVVGELSINWRLERMDRILEGFTSPDGNVTVNKLLPLPRRRFVLAHEMAHVLVRRGVMVVDRRYEEQTADDFARHLLLPPDLEGFSELPARELASTYETPVSEAVQQQMNYSVIDYLLVNVEGIVCCATCHHTRSFITTFCVNCSRARRNDRERAQLPKL